MRSEPNYTAGVRNAYEHIGPEITMMISEEGYDALPIAWAFMGAITNIVRQVPGVTEKEVEKLVCDLIQHVNEAQPKAA